MKDCPEPGILYIWDADYPWDVRVEKICQSLKNHRYRVHIAARNLKKRPENEIVDGLHIHRLKTKNNDKLNYTYSFPLFFSPVWRTFLDRIIQNHKIGLIIVRDLPMAIAGIWAGKRHGIPVIFDMAEDYVAMIKDIWDARKFQGINLLVRNPYFAKIVERYTLTNSDHILVVVDEARELVIARGGHPERVSIVGNTPPLELFNQNHIEMNNNLKRMRDHFTGIYTGGIQMGRGIQIVLDAIPEIVKNVPDFLFAVVGDGYALPHLRNEAIKRGLQDYVLWVGWVNHERIFDYIRASKIGIIPHFVSDHVNTTIPNKIFDYMGLGIPVIASDAVPLKRIIEEERCGLTFMSGNPDDLSKAVLSIFCSENDYGANGMRAVEKKYNWNQDEKRLLKVIDSFIKTL